ncbi:MAG: primosomal protein N' [Pirellulales bacterium]|nr:primosomal protein N' [Pirellulales bacterium]
MSDQRNLFEEPSEPWESDDRAEQLVASVILAEGPEREFDYFVPDELHGQIEPGKRVRVPFGRSNRPVPAYCVRLADKPVGQRKLKAVQAVLDARNLLSPAMLRLTKWIADYYLCSWASALATVLPAGVRTGAGTRLTTFLSLDPDFKSKLESEKIPPKQQMVLKVLAAGTSPMTAAELAREAKCTAAPIAALRRKALIRSHTARLHVGQQSASSIVRERHLVMNPDQRRALEAILRTMRAKEYRTILIHGVTGSGKTEVYIQAIQEVIHFGRQAIVLVPEISLTPQTVERFRSRFGEVAVLHSHLTDAERHWHWQRIAEGKVPVVVGARSAIFAPTPHLGLIVMDEEHEASFKQDSAPRYHARDVAIERAKAEAVPLVLGSATPSLESWHKARVGGYLAVEMPRRVLDRPLPTVGTIDLRIDKNRGALTRGAIGRQLHAAVVQALEGGGQVILLLNRRGYSTHIQCPACGNVLKCPHCDIALTHHRTQEIALCHFCDYEVPAPTSCPGCGFLGIRYSGQGTQRLEAEVRARFPNVPCLRMDTDTMQGRGSHERAFAAFRAGKVKILLGTQMIAKGLDFPDVTLVGVINADTALHLPDFRAAERTFQLVTQVAGRTGRGERGGRVLVQTFNPDHPAILAAVRHDYAAFAAGELPIREMLKYPPFSRMIRLVVRGPVETAALAFAKSLAANLTAALAVETAEARVLGPAPAPFAKLRGLYRFQIQIQGPDGERLRAAVRKTAAELKPPDEVQWIADVDPLDMM